MEFIIVFFKFVGKILLATSAAILIPIALIICLIEFIGDLLFGIIEIFIIKRSDGIERSIERSNNFFHSLLEKVFTCIVEIIKA